MPRTVFDVPALKARQQDLEQLAAQPDFWDDQQNAQKQMRRLDEVKAQLQQLAGWGSVQLAVAADACPLRTCNAISGGGEERSKTSVSAAQSPFRTCIRGERGGRAAGQPAPGRVGGGAQGTVRN